MEQTEMETQLWDYIDGTIPEPGRSAIEKLIADNSEWKRKYHELLEVHSLIHATELEHPSMRFTKNVMEEIAKYKIAPAAKEYINKKIIWSIALFFIIAVVGFLVYGFSQVNWSEAGSDNVLGVDITKVDYSMMFNNTYMNLFMMLNVVLGLMLLDNYLTNKRKKFIQDAG